MTEPLELESIKARLAAVTPGRWVWCDFGGAPEDAGEITDLQGSRRAWGGRLSIEAEPLDDDEAWGPEGREVVFVLGPVEDDNDNEQVYEIPISDADAALIVNAPTDIAALVAEVERLRARLGPTL